MGDLTPRSQDSKLSTAVPLHHGSLQPLLSQEPKLSGPPDRRVLLRSSETPRLWKRLPLPQLLSTPSLVGSRKQKPAVPKADASPSAL